MFSANVYRIMIGCPGDIQEEVEIAKRVINRWTSIHAEQRETVLLPINWSVNSYPEYGAHPQKILNNQLADKSDLLIAIFGSRVGTPTDTSTSGTIEEIEHHIDAGKPVMLFFRKVNDISKITATEFARLEAFKRSIQNRGLYKEYNTERDFEEVFSDALDLFLDNHWLDKSPSLSRKEETIEFSAEEIDRLKKWTDSKYSEAHSVVDKDGTVFIVGDSQYRITGARDLAKWNDFFYRLQKKRFVELSRHNRSGRPVYQLLTPAYDFVDKLDKQ